MTLQDQGFRFMYQHGVYRWIHPAEIEAGSVDCTDMDDAAFEAHVHARDAEIMRGSGAPS